MRILLIGQHIICNKERNKFIHLPNFFVVFVYSSFRIRSSSSPVFIDPFEQFLKIIIINLSLKTLNKIKIHQFFHRFSSSYSLSNYSFLSKQNSFSINELISKHTDKYTQRTLKREKAQNHKALTIKTLIKTRLLILTG